MALPTLKEADDHLVAILPETGTGGHFAATTTRYRAIANVVNRIAWATGVNQQNDDLAITTDTTEYDLSTVGPADAAFHPSRLLEIRIGDYSALRPAFGEDDLRRDLRAGSVAQPTGYWFPTPHTLLIVPVPDQDYTAQVRWVPPIVIDPAEATPSGVTIPIPGDWLYEGLDLGAWHYLTRTRDKFDHSEPVNQAFEVFLARIGLKHATPAISGSRAPFDPLM